MVIAKSNVHSSSYKTETTRRDLVEALISEEFAVAVYSLVSLWPQGRLPVKADP